MGWTLARSQRHHRDGDMRSIVRVAPSPRRTLHVRIWRRQRPYKLLLGFRSCPPSAPHSKGRRRHRRALWRRGRVPQSSRPGQVKPRAGGQKQRYSAVFCARCICPWCRCARCWMPRDAHADCRRLACHPYRYAGPSVFDNYCGFPCNQHRRRRRGWSLHASRWPLVCYRVRCGSHISAQR